jgi:hypothetical protein
LRPKNLCIFIHVHRSARVAFHFIGVGLPFKSQINNQKLKTLHRLTLRTSHLLSRHHASPRHANTNFLAPSFQSSYSETSRECLPLAAPTSGAVAFAALSQLNQTAAPARACAPAFPAIPQPQFRVAVGNERAKIFFRRAKAYQMSNIPRTPTAPKCLVFLFDRLTLLFCCMYGNQRPKVLLTPLFSCMLLKNCE